jgi:hypothetical protein
VIRELQQWITSWTSVQQLDTYGFPLPHPWRSELLNFMPQVDIKLNEWWCRLNTFQTKKKRLELATISITCCRGLWIETNNKVFDRLSAMEETLIR